MTDKMKEQIKKEAIFGTAPVSKSEKRYGFWDAFLVLSGYGVATWCYTQGAYVASFLSFKQLLLSTFSAHLILLTLYLLPIIMATRYGIDTWVWFKSIFGTVGIKIVAVIVIIINFPWYAVCADLFAGSMTNMFAGFGITIPDGMHMWLSLFCVVAGTLMAFKGPNTITKVTRIMVPLLLAVGVYVIYVASTSVPFSDLWNYVPQSASRENYMRSIEGNFGFAIAWCGTIAVTARMCKKESQGYWATCMSMGGVTPFFILAGGVMAIAMFLRSGEYVSDPTIMLASLSGPIAALLSLVLVAFANIGTQGVGSYLYAVMLKTSFPKISYNWHVAILGAYVAVYCVWGQLISYFGAFLSITAYLYAPINAVLVVDFFFLRKQKLSFRSAYEYKGYHAYRYKNGFNPVGFACLIVGSLIPLLVYNPFTGQIYSNVFLFTTATGLGFVASGLLYYFVTKIPKIRAYMLQDRNELTVDNNG